MRDEDLRTYLELAESAALAAGARLSARPETWQGVDVEEGKDIKVKADRQSEDMIREILSQGSNIPILGEESGWSGQMDSSGLAWIVDPLDGSANYNRRIPLCAVSIALLEGNTLRLGVIYDFNAKELYAGIVGQGAWLNQDPMRVSGIRERSKSVLMTGLPVRRDFSPEALADMAADMAQWKKVRMIGSAALAVAYVASGRADYYREENTMFWDIAAGCALVLAAGGTVEISEGPLNQPKNVIAHNGHLK